ncbi:MAG: hypothetical protein HY016_13200 [Nitrosomonadales bacterium]|nr:hypothetical protein [Nitrosomonadales bacterium]
MQFKMPIPNSAALLKRPASLLVLLTATALSATLSGCGKSETHSAATDETNRLCGAILDTGLTKKCALNDRDNTVNIVINTNDEAARSLCVDIANKVKPLTAELDSRLKLQVFSPYRDDKPLAYCALHY